MGALAPVNTFFQYPMQGLGIYDLSEREFEEIVANTGPLIKVEARGLLALQCLTSLLAIIIISIIGPFVALGATPFGEGKNTLKDTYDLLRMHLTVGIPVGFKGTFQPLTSTMHQFLERRDQCIENCYNVVREPKPTPPTPIELPKKEPNIVNGIMIAACSFV
jgi:hypothetical protein